jgi:hypothetical protein
MEVIREFVCGMSGDACSIVEIDGVEICVLTRELN